MIVSDGARVVFVHVQKTGGHTIDGLLTAALPDARRVEGLKRHAPLGRLIGQEPGLADYWTFGFVRNPWARMVSWWAMIQNFRRHEGEGRATMLRTHGFMSRVAGYPDFETFVDRGPVELPRLGRPQVGYLRAGRHRADLVGRTEAFDADVRRVFDHLDLPPPALIPHTNRSRSGDYRAYYTDASRRRVAEVFARDLDAFGYTF